jgi:hypothetical protein
MANHCASLRHIPDCAETSAPAFQACAIAGTLPRAPRGEAASCQEAKPGSLIRSEGRAADTSLPGADKGRVDPPPSSGYNALAGG